MPLSEPVLLCVVGIFEKEEMHAQTYMNKVRIQIDTLPFENEGKKVSSDVMLDRVRGRGRERERWQHADQQAGECLKPLSAFSWQFRLNECSDPVYVRVRDSKVYTWEEVARIMCDRKAREAARARAAIAQQAQAEKLAARQAKAKQKEEEKAAKQRERAAAKQARQEAKQAKTRGRARACGGKSSLSARLADSDNSSATGEQHTNMGSCCSQNDLYDGTVERMDAYDYSADDGTHVTVSDDDVAGSCGQGSTYRARRLSDVMEESSPGSALKVRRTSERDADDASRSEPTEAAAHKVGARNWDWSNVGVGSFDDQDDVQLASAGRDVHACHVLVDSDSSARNAFASPRGRDVRGVKHSRLERSSDSESSVEKLSSRKKSKASSSWDAANSPNRSRDSHLPQARNGSTRCAPLAASTGSSANSSSPSLHKQARRVSTRKSPWSSKKKATTPLDAGSSGACGYSPDNDNDDALSDVDALEPAVAASSIAARTATSNDVQVRHIASSEGARSSDRLVRPAAASSARDLGWEARGDEAMKPTQGGGTMPRSDTGGHAGGHVRVDVIDLT
jgi:hypothetical protein